jgi:hypothetical protein
MIISKYNVNSWYYWFSWHGSFQGHGAKNTKGTNLISLRTHQIHTPLASHFPHTQILASHFTNECHLVRQD